MVPHFPNRTAKQVVAEPVGYRDRLCRRIFYFNYGHRNVSIRTRGTAVAQKQRGQIAFISPLLAFLLL